MKRTTIFADESLMNEVKELSKEENKSVAEIIRDAMEHGEFDNLAGSGKAMDLTAYFAAPPERRLEFSVLKNAGMFPREVELIQEIDTLAKAREQTQSSADRLLLTRRIRDLRLSLSVLMESRRTSGRRPNPSQAISSPFLGP